MQSYLRHKAHFGLCGIQSECNHKTSLVNGNPFKMMRNSVKDEKSNEMKMKVQTIHDTVGLSPMNKCENSAARSVVNSRQFGFKLVSDSKIL